MQVKASVLLLVSVSALASVSASGMTLEAEQWGQAWMESVEARLQRFYPPSP